MNIKSTNEMNPLEIISYIDGWYEEAKKNKWSRLSVEWGKWSRSMNVETIKRAKTDKYRVALALIFNYWVVRSKMLENNNSFFGRFLNRKFETESRMIIDDIMYEMNNPTPFHKIPSFESYMKNLVLK